MTKRIVPTLIFLFALALASLGCSRAGAPDPRLAARVNGKSITRAELEKNFNFRSQGMPQKPAGVAANLAKMEVLHDLIERELMAQKADQLKVEVKDADVDAQIQQLRGESSPDQFKRDLEQRGFTEQEMRGEIHKTLAVQRMIQDQVNSKVNVTSEDVSRFFNDNKESFNVKELQYRIGGIVVTANAGGQINNLKNDKALNDDQARGKAQKLLEQLHSGGDFTELAKEYSEDPQTAPMGGDLGFQSVSALDRMGPELKQAIMKMAVGDITPVISAQNAYWIFKLTGKREPGQRSLQDPDVSEAIRSELANQKQQLLASAFSEELHNEAKIENFLAKEILASNQKK